MWPIGRHSLLSAVVCLWLVCVSRVNSIRLQEERKVVPCYPEYMGRRALEHMLEVMAKQVKLNCPDDTAILRSPTAKVQAQSLATILHHNFWCFPATAVGFVSPRPTWMQQPRL